MWQTMYNTRTAGLEAAVYYCRSAGLQACRLEKPQLPRARHEPLFFRVTIERFQPLELLVAEGVLNIIAQVPLRDSLPARVVRVIGTRYFISPRDPLVSGTLKQGHLVRVHRRRPPGPHRINERQPG